MVTIVSLLIAGIIPAAVLFFIHSRNMYQTGGKMVWISFGWGVIAYGIAALINGQILLKGGVVDTLTLVKYITPWQEEILKALILIILMRSINFTYFVDGAIFGFAIGIGFAIAENVEYVFAYQNAALGVSISRVISTNLMHAAATALTGIAFGYGRFYKGFEKVPTILAGLAAAIAVHLGFNNLVNEVSSSFLLLYAAGTGIGATVIIFFVIRNGLKKAKNWIQDNLGKADRVTKSESTMAQQVGSAKSFLAPLEEMFGKGQAKQIEEFLLLQARLGIHRENLTKFQDEKLLEETQKEITTLSQKMNELRIAVGPYKMAMLRSFFPEEENQVWQQLTSTIEERMKAPTHTRGGLWDKLENKVK